ncbi:hypothetical protein AA103587_1129 [Gluconobacter kanchanaburiensis NBRC 103587]|nr:hypothetical protein AA103587_1129 [Gluconobacter kanchanaburiensis NBRC 103587]
MAICIVGAATGMGIQKSAGNVCVNDFVRVFVAQFVKTAAAASVTKGFPLFRRHLIQRNGLPERGRRRAHKWSTRAQATEKTVARARERNREGMRRGSQIRRRRI